jgi:predicted nucleic acid-binding Zn ribbon protein
VTEKIKQHHHCQICGKAIPLEEQFCSEDCRQKYGQMVKRRKILIYAMYALIGIILVIILFGNGL